MTELIISALTDAGVDTLKLIPFLFVTYLVMEALERKTEGHSANLIAEAGKWGPIAGALVGIVPQCGFSAAASSLYAGGLISIGTLLAVFLSTSDEMLPIFISEQVAVPTMVKILAAKAVIGALTGLGIDFILRFTRYKDKTGKRIHDLCEHEHCGCEEEEGGIVRSALVHTLHIVIFVFLISFALTLLVEGLGEKTIAGILTGRPVIGTLLAGLIGLIPNCAASVMITELYLEGMLGAGQMMAGLLVGAGVGLLVLFRTNARPKENLKITAILYAAGIFWGILIELAGIRF
ncbi:MAG: putative manganese transporter [Lachnospiraceae bacterium]|nr:putative manganese transporter [Lachnospiraceae bacterium]